MRKAPTTRVVRRKGVATISTSREVTAKDLKVEHTEKEPLPDPLPAHPAYVEVSGGLTKNMGNYESVRVGVSISVPCKPTTKAIAKAHEKLSDLVADLVEYELERAMQDVEDDDL